MDEALRDEALKTKADENSVEMKIPARAEWVRVARLATAGVAARLGFSYDDIEDLKLAVAEACNNAILHGGNSSQDGASSTPIVTIRWTISPDRLQISVSDEGRLSNEISLPALSSDSLSGEKSASSELPESGMGLLLIQSLMDEVEHRTGADFNTTLTMTRFAPPSKTAPSSTSKSGATEKGALPVSEEARRLMSDALRPS